MNPDSHITLEWHDVYGDHYTETLAAPKVVLAEAEAWREQQGASPQQVRDWLVARGAQLDCVDAPASIVRTADGSVTESWFRNGLGHRDDGPASVSRGSDGTILEEYWRNGAYPADRPGVIVRYADGSTFEGWLNAAGSYHREGGPAVIERKRDGTGTLGYWNDGTLVSEAPMHPPKKKSRSFEL